MKVTIQFNEGVERKDKLCTILDGAVSVETVYGKAFGFLELTWGSECKHYLKKHRWESDEEAEEAPLHKSGVWRVKLSAIDYIKIENHTKQ